VNPGVARPEFRPRAWPDELPQLDASGMLVFQVAGQQLSVRSIRPRTSWLGFPIAGGRIEACQ